MKAQLKMHNGTPTVFLDDQPAFFGCHLIGGMDPAAMKLDMPYMRRYAEAGVHIYSTGTPNETWPGPRPGNPYPYDFSMVPAGMQPYIDADPKAMFLVRMAFDTQWTPGRWWNKLYPDEVEIMSDGARVGNSFASTIWQEQVKGQLRDFIPFLKEAGLYDRVLGFQIGAGSSGEWIKDTSCMMLPTVDYSPPMRRHFRAWLRQKYQTDAALQAAWADGQMTLDTAEVPSQAEQSTTTTGGSFRDPRRERKTIDYYECFAELCADDFIGFAETVREATQGEKLVGGFFGYVLDLAWNMAFFAGNQSIEAAEVSTMQTSGHLGLRKLLRSPAVDFLVSPHGYAFRGLGGDGLPMQPAESLRRHGKLYLMEEDALMHNNFDPGGRNQSVENSIAV